MTFPSLTARNEDQDEEQAGPPLCTRTRLVDDPGDLLDHLGPAGFAWLTGGTGFVTAGVAARVAVEPGPDRFERAADDVARRLASIRSTGDEPRPAGSGPVACGALPFDDAVTGHLVVPAVMVGRAVDGRAWITETGPADFSAADFSAAALSPGRPSAPVRNGHAHGGDGPLAVKAGTAREAWLEAVRRVLAAIDGGDVRKVVLARELVLEAAAPFDRRGVLDRLRRNNPSCFVYADGAFLGASPELLVRRSGDEVRSCPMAGTVRRSPDRDEDDRLVAGLRQSGKEAEEHRLLVEAVVEALLPVCARPPRAAGSEVVRLATVSHLATVVSGALAAPAPSALALAGRLHPTPAVGGLPRAAALEAIARLEGFDRGLYAGPVGWVDAAGDGEWAVALRGAELDGARARLIAGAGIVAGSDPEAEWSETEAKLQAMLGAFLP